MLTALSFAIKTKLFVTCDLGLASLPYQHNRQKERLSWLTDVLGHRHRYNPTRRPGYLLHLVQREHLLDEVFRLVRHGAPILRVERHFPCACSSGGALNNERREGGTRQRETGTETGRGRGRRQTADRRIETEKERRREAQARRSFDVAHRREAMSSYRSPQPLTRDNDNATSQAQAPKKKKTKRKNVT